MKRFLIILSLLVFVFSSYAMAAELYIGLSAPLTGDYAQYGEVFKKGVELALEEFNEKGGLNGIKIKLIAMDSKGDPKEAANIAQKFVMDKRIIAEIGDFTSTCCLAAAPIYQRAGLVQLSPTSSHPDFTKQGDYMFRNIITQEAEGPYIAEYAYKDLGKKKAAVIYIQNDWGIVAKENFIKGFKALGGEIVAEEKFNPGTKDYTNILTKIKAKNPEIIYIAMMYSEAALLAKQMKKLGMNIPLIGTGALYSPKLIELGGDAVEGLYCTSSFYPYSEDPIVKSFVEKYKAKYGTIPNMFAAQAYDAAGLILTALKSIKGKITRKAVKEALEKIKDYPGVTGLTTFDENHNVKKKLTKLVVKNGDFVEFKK